MRQAASIVITGSASGIGHGLAQQFVARGCRVMLADLPGSRLDAAAAALGAPDLVACQPCDVSQREQLQRLWEAASRRFGRVDVWLNNAGVGPPVIRLDAVPPDWIDRAIDVNIRGVMHGTQVALTGMLRQGGGAIYNTVGFGYDGRKQDDLTVYGTTKAAARYFSESTARELGDCPVRVSWLNPGFVLTPMTIEENRRIRERIGEARWRKIRWVMNAIADTPEAATPWLVERILKGTRPIDRLPPGVFLRRLLASLLTRPDPLSRHGL
ncbi:MAG: SDR family oxidoreductase [Gammaproteobacteria bacterium]|nr:SDR family oxidoreductase [Gammaproteobacteria bacterium]